MQGKKKSVDAGTLLLVDHHQPSDQQIGNPAGAKRQDQIAKIPLRNRDQKYHHQRNRRRGHAGDHAWKKHAGKITPSGIAGKPYEQGEKYESADDRGRNQRAHGRSGSPGYFHQRNGEGNLEQTSDKHGQRHAAVVSGHEQIMGGQAFKRYQQVSGCHHDPGDADGRAALDLEPDKHDRLRQNGEEQEGPGADEHHQPGTVKHDYLQTFALASLVHGGGQRGDVFLELTGKDADHFRDTGSKLVDGDAAHAGDDTKDDAVTLEDDHIGDGQKIGEGAETGDVPEGLQIEAGKIKPQSGKKLHDYHGEHDVRAKTEDHRKHRQRKQSAAKMKNQHHPRKLDCLVDDKNIITQVNAVESDQDLGKYPGGEHQGYADAEDQEHLAVIPDGFLVALKLEDVINMKGHNPGGGNDQ